MTFVDHFLHILDRFVVERYGAKSRVPREEIGKDSKDIERLKKIIGEGGEDR